MKINYLQHVEFEGPASIVEYCKERQIEITGYHIYKNQVFPPKDNTDLLIILGGPMGVYDEAHFPWLKEEKKYIESLVKNNKKILGICLGAQLLANVLGAKVYKNSYKEIGWFPVYSTLDAINQYSFIPKDFIAFHWHGDTFDLPENSTHLFYNEVTKNQGFVYNNKVWALQFHLESTEESISSLYYYAKEDLQTNQEKFIKKYNYLENQAYTKESNSLLYKLLDFVLEI